MMSFFVPTTYDTSVNLQSTVSSATADGSLAGTINGPHHPITCGVGELYYDEDGTMRCDHSSAPPDNPRNQAILDASMAILLFQELEKRERTKT